MRWRVDGRWERPAPAYLRIVASLFAAGIGRSGFAPMKVGVVIPSFHGGGAEFVARRWIGALCEHGHDVYVYTYDPPAADSPFSARVTHRHFERTSPPARFGGLPVWLRRQTGRDELDVVLSLLTFTNLVTLMGLCVGRRLGVPVVISERSMPTVALAAEGRSGTIKRWLASRVYRRASAVIAISHPVAGDLIGGYRVPLAKLHVVPNPVVNRATPMPLAAPSKRDLRVVFVGRLVQTKRPKLFIDTLTVLTSQGVTVSGVVIGDGPMRVELEHHAQVSGVSVEFLGWREPWWEATRKIDCLVLPSLIEGFGNVLVEAARAEIPCVAASSALGVSDAMIPGVTGELAVEDTPFELAQAVLRATAPDQGEAVERWLKRFSLENSVGVLLHVLNRVTSESQSLDAR